MQKIYIDLSEVETNDNLTSFTVKEKVGDINIQQTIRMPPKCKFQEGIFSYYYIA